MGLSDRCSFDGGTASRGAFPLPIFLFRAMGLRMCRNFNDPAAANTVKRIPVA
jgi:hypothetical protein